MVDTQGSTTKPSSHHHHLSLIHPPSLHLERSASLFFTPHKPTLYPTTPTTRAMLSTVLRRACAVGSSSGPAGGAAALLMRRPPQPASSSPSSAAAAAAAVAGHSCRAAFSTQSSSSSFLSLSNLSDNPGAKTEVGGLVCVGGELSIDLSRHRHRQQPKLSTHSTHATIPTLPTPFLPSLPAPSNTAHARRPGLRLREG